MEKKGEGDLSLRLEGETILPKEFAEQNGPLALMILFFFSAIL